MPAICCIFCAKMDSATSYSCGWVAVADVSAKSKISDSAGFTLRQVGLVGRFAGSWPRAALMAAWTSRPAASMSRSRSNCMTMLVLPNWLTDVICVMPAMRPNMRSSGVATEEAMVSGLAPGRFGKHVDRRILHFGQRGDRDMGESNTAGQQQRDRQQRSGDRALNKGGGYVHWLVPDLMGGTGVPTVASAQPAGELIKPNVDHRRGVQRQHLAEQQAADDGDAKRMTQLGAGSLPMASGKPPKSAAMVVIMMGRKRSRHAW